ncbi:MAG: DNA integrity scanning protein DisA nucleotide-binding domain protein [Clostridia bacterium]|nr:DNA integrity scanning protein DisA nucleotide-binding domain protein [Clostridia bacterium]
MLDFLKSFATNLQLPQIIAGVVVILASTIILNTVFQYAKNRNLSWLISLEVAALLGVFCLAFCNLPNYPFYFYFVVGTLAVLNVFMFGQDFRRDVFRKSWKKHGVFEANDKLGREELKKASADILRACQHLSRSNIGALIIIADDMAESISESGTSLMANVSAELLETLFHPNTPLHDGAVLITANVIVSAGCYVPLTQDLDVPREFGSRHRAAIGISENMPNVTAIVVSEETGIISAMHDGKVQRYLDAVKLKQILDHALRLTNKEAEETIWGIEV